MACNLTVRPGTGLAPCVSIPCQAAARYRGLVHGSASQLLLGITLAVLVVALTALARRLPIPSPILQVAAGALLALIPGVSVPSLDPDLVFFYSRLRRRFILTGIVGGVRDEARVHAPDVYTCVTVEGNTNHDAPSHRSPSPHRGAVRHAR